jgi:ribonucrease Y
MFTGILIGASIVWLFHTIRYQSLRNRILACSSEQHKKEIDLLQKRSQAFSAEITQKNTELLSREGLLQKHTSHLTQEQLLVKKGQTHLQILEKELAKKELHISELLHQAKKKLEDISCLSLEEAKNQLLERAQVESAREIQIIKRSLYHAHEKESSRQALEFLFAALERKTQSLTKEVFLTEMPITNPSVIPSFIGKEGRHIHLLETLLNVKLLLEDKTLLISSHDSKHRFIAQKVLSDLLQKEKITLPLIQASVENTLGTIEKLIQAEGRKALELIDSPSLYSEHVQSTLGSLALKTSSGQNLLKHSLEVAELMGMLAGELQLRPKMAKLMGLFHDIGKTLPSNYGDSHATAGKIFLTEQQFPEEIINAVASHHGEYIAKTSEARLLPICDRLSAQLPGIRSAQEPAFLAVVRQCENLSKQEPSVLSAWAHYGGTHIELIIRPKCKQEDLSLKARIETRLSSIPLPVTITLLEHGS